MNVWILNKQVSFMDGRRFLLSSNLVQSARVWGIPQGLAY